jgi:hypothetical protein
VNVADLTEFDVAVLPGCVLYEHALEKYYKILRKVRSENIPLILLGAGGGDYSDSTQRYVRQFTDEVEPAAIITRDSTAYNCYSDEAKYTSDGIDNAFFINEWYDPPSSDVDYDVATFDKTNPDVDSERDIIYSDHYPFEQPYGNLWQKFKKHMKQRRIFDRKNYFLSDTLEDYLFLYSNARVTYSDRIHACVPTLAYGNRAQFTFDTPRGELFEKVISDDIHSDPVSLDNSLIRRLKDEQVEAFKSAVETSDTNI